MVYIRIYLTFLLSVLFFNTSLSQEIKIIKTEIFEVCYSEEYQQPLYLTYEVACTEGEVSRKGLDFYKVPGVITSDDDDYIGNVWDKGHLAPAASFNCTEEMLYQTFSYLNCVLQHEKLNRGPWKDLESAERTIARVVGGVRVLVIVHFNKEQYLPTGAKIPSGFTKILVLGDKKYAFYFPNEDLGKRSWVEFKIK